MLKQLSEQSQYQGKLIQIITRQIEYGEGDKTGTFTAEIARRPPGVRCLIVDGTHILLTKEFRAELGRWDYRLAGGKVFDSLQEYLDQLEEDSSSQKFEQLAEQAARKEAFEEVGIYADKAHFLHKSTCGASIIWDLYYFELSGIRQQEQNLEDGEIIIPEWHTFEEVETLCYSGGISEDTTVAILLRYLNKRYHEQLLTLVQA